MPANDRPSTTVRSPDGTEIACWVSGDGPPLVLVHGTTADHSRWAPLLPLLEPHVTVWALDRRGRGSSGDAPGYALEREYEDVAAVADAAAADAGAPVAVLGHSFGGVCAFGAARLTSNVGSLVLYEGWPASDPDAIAFPVELQHRIERLVEQGEREAALEAFVREIVHMPDEELAAYRRLPAWQARIAAVHTIVRESRAIAFDPKEAAKIGVPVLLLVGGNSPESIRQDPERVAAALPDARIVVLEGQQHIAIDLVPELFAAHVLAYLREVAR